MTNMPDDIKDKTPEEEQDALLESNTVKLWQKRVKDAKKLFQNDFDRMKENMEFAAGIQRHGQEKMESEHYVANFINREVNQKVASLYARDPKVIARRRKRLDFQIWDGDIATEQSAAVAMSHYQAMSQQNPAMQQMGMPPQIVQAQALLADIAHGKQWQKLVKKVGDTLEILYGYNCDTQTPDFKFQMKQLVRRVVTNGVGYVRLNFSRQGDHALTSSGTDDSLSMRIKRAKRILSGIDDDKIEDDDPRQEQLQQLFESVQSSVQNGDMTNIEERLEFDFPSSTSIIVDPKCRCLKGFVGARWIAQEFKMPLEEANAYFETDIKAGGELITYSERGQELVKGDPSQATKDPQEKPIGCFWEVFDITTKSHFFICDGWKEFVQEPQPLEPSINRFWPVFALTFNDTEVEPGCKITLYPPSDVDLLKPVQKEWNRIGEELKKHRKANRPFYLAMNGMLTDTDKEKLGDHETCELISIKGIPPSGKLTDVIAKFDSVPIDATLYNTGNLQMDAGMVVGSNSQQSQQPQRHVAATPAMIQEQARVSGVNSNVDDLDDLLSELARAGGEMLLRELSEDTVKRIAGVGAVFPQQQREDFLNELFLEIVASSSGRPNKAVEIANFREIAPLLLQAGANPWAVIKEAVNRLDDRLDTSDFAPSTPPTQGPAKKPGAAGHPATGQPAPGSGPVQGASAVMGQ